MKKSLQIIVLVFAIVVATGISLLVVMHSVGQHAYPNLIVCLQENNIILFGSSGNPDSQAQREVFGASAKKVPYFECISKSTGYLPSSSCESRNITSYPTWQFNHGYLASLPDEIWSEFGLAYDEYAESEYFPEDQTRIPVESSNFAKLQAIVAPNGISYYNSGRLPGIRTLGETALFSGCEEALAVDRSKS